MSNDDEIARHPGKVVLVTGGASGIGAGIARYLEDRGMSVITADLQASAVGDYLPLDVVDEQQWVDLVARVVERYCRIDACIHAAGVNQGEALLQFDRTMFDRVVRINLTGTFLAIKHVGPVIADSGGGTILAFSSVEGLQGANSMGAYGASKWGVRGLTRVAAIELGESRVRVNSIHPGPINTPMVNPKQLPVDQITHLSLLERMPISRIADVSEVAAMCAYLISDEASFVTGAEFVIDGGLVAGNKVLRSPNGSTPPLFGYDNSVSTSIPSG